MLQDSAEKNSVPIVRCLLCRRVLHNPVSVTRKMGPSCWSRISAAVGSLQGSVNVAAVKAARALSTGGYSPTKVAGLFAIPSATTEEVWHADKYSCTCPGGARGVLCYHRVGVVVLTAC